MAAYTGRDERPAPVLLPDGGLVVPGSLCAELGGALELLDAFVRGVAPTTRAVRLSRAALVVLMASREAAAQHQRHLSQQASAAPTVTLLPPAQPLRLSEHELITTAEAAQIAGVSAEWIRRLAADQRIRAQRAPRNTWLVHLGDVRAWRDGRRGSTTDDTGTDPGRQAEPGAA